MLDEGGNAVFVKLDGGIERWVAQGKVGRAMIEDNGRKPLSEWG